MRKKTRKLSIVTKQLLLIGMVVWIAICIIVAIITNTRRNDMVEMAKEECVAIVTLLDDYINVEQLEKINESKGKDDAYKDLQLQLNEAMNNSTMQYIYTLWTDGKNVYYGVDGDTKETIPYGEKFEENYSYLVKAFNGETVVDDDYSKDEDGNYLISAYIPLMNENGEVESILACDFDANDVYAKVVKAWTWLFIWATLGTLLASVSLFIIIKGTTKNIIVLNEKIDELVNSNGDLTKELDIKSGDELENLSDSINELLRYIRNIMINIDDNSKNLMITSEELSKNTAESKDESLAISATMEQMSASTEETSASIVQIVGATDVIKDVVTELSEKAIEYKNSSLEIKSKAEELYQNSLREQNESKIKTNEIIQSVQEQIKKSESVKEIENLTQSILEISSQTALLSLNASIEAAHAGEFGKGFAVVAEEIGKLAKKSAEAASEIQEVSKIVISSVDSLTKETKKMESFIEHEISHSYNQLLETSQEYEENMQTIFENMNYFEQQSNDVNNKMIDINDSLTTINIAMEENAQGIQNVAHSVSNLTETIQDIDNKTEISLNISQSLDNEVNKFTI